MDHKEKTSIKNERNFVIYFRNSLNKLKAKTKWIKKKNKFLSQIALKVKK